MAPMPLWIKMVMEIMHRILRTKILMRSWPLAKRRSFNTIRVCIRCRRVPSMLLNMKKEHSLM